MNKELVEIFEGESISDAEKQLKTFLNRNKEVSILFVTNVNKKKTKVIILKYEKK